MSTKKLPEPMETGKYTCNGLNLRFQRMAAAHGVEALDVLGAGRGARGDGRLPFGSLIFAAVLLALGRCEKIANCDRCEYTADKAGNRCGIASHGEKRIERGA